MFIKYNNILCITVLGILGIMFILAFYVQGLKILRLLLSYSLKSDILKFFFTIYFENVLSNSS